MIQKNLPASPIVAIIVLVSSLGWASSCPADANSTGATPQAAPAAPATTPAAQVRYCNQKSIQLRYRWQGADPAGVQMWIHMGDQDWLPWQWSDKPAEPVTFAPPRQGRITLALAAAAMESSEPPPPDCQTITLLFDWDKPLLRLTSVRLTTTGSPTLHLTWAAWDENFGERPISLYWRPAPDLPWQLGVNNLPNSGVYEWDIPSFLAGRKIEVNLRATDLASNMADATVAMEVPAKGTLSSSGTVVKVTQIEPAAPTIPAAPLTGRTPQTSTTPQVPTARPAAQTPAVAPTPVTTTTPPARAVPSEAPAKPAAPGAPAASLAQATLQPAASEPAGSADAAPTASQPQPEAVSAEAERLNQLAQQQLARDNFEIAEDLLRQAVDADPSFYQARLQLAVLLQRRGQTQQAVHEYEAVLAVKPDNSAAWKNLALAHMSVKDYPKARVTLQKLLAVEADNPQTWLDLGDVEMLSGRPEAARQYWEKARSLTKPDTEIATKAGKRLTAYVK